MFITSDYSGRPVSRRFLSGCKSNGLAQDGNINSNKTIKRISIITKYFECKGKVVPVLN